MCVKKESRLPVRISRLSYPAYQQGFSPPIMAVTISQFSIINLVCLIKNSRSTSLFSLGEESDGTIRLLDLLEVLLSTLPNMVYVIDEVSRCLHPLLTKQFVQNFLSLAAARNVQLIVTTHGANLMNLDLLRQDEIGFVEKQEDDGTSVIYGLEEFGARFDKRIRKACLEGQYNAVPKFGKDG